MKPVYNTTFFIASDNFDALEKDIKGLNVPYKVVKGGYTHKDGTKVTELSLCVITDNINEIVRIGRVHNQESVLKLDMTRNASIVYLNDLKDVYIGQFKEVDRDTALNSSGYTYDLQTDKYFTCTK